MRALARRGQPTDTVNSITSKEWEAHLKGVDFTKYRIFSLWNKEQRHFSQYKPSDLLAKGEYPFSNMEENQMVLTVGGNFLYFDSNDDKQIM